MSPVAVEFQSPFSTRPSSSLQSSSVNPNSNPFSSTKDHSQNQSSSTNYDSSSGLDNDNDFGFGIGVGVGNGNCFVPHSGSRFGSGRPRARLVKLRKQVGKSRTSASETGFGFNPFRSAGEDYSANLSFSNNGGLENSNRVSNEATVSNEFCFVNNENAGFVFGANASNVGFDFNLEKRDTSECTVKSGSGFEGKMKSENEHEHEQECGNDSNVRCQFCAGGNDLCLNLNLEKEEFGGTLKKPASIRQSGINQNDLGSSSNIIKSECNLNVDDSGLGFVFGASWCNSASNSNLEGSDSIEKNGKTVYDDQIKMKVESKMESQKVKATEARFNGDGSLLGNEDYGEYVFVFGGGNKKSSCSDDCGTSNCPNEMKLKSKSFQNGNIGKPENGNLNFDVNSKSNFVSESTGSNIGSASIADAFFKLPDVMKKLNINEFENDNGIDKKYDTNRNSCTSADATFVFRSSIKPCSSSNGSSVPTDEPISCPTAAVDRTARDNFGNDGNDPVIFGNSCNIDNASCGSSSYQPFMDQARLGKSSNAGLFSSCKVNSDAQANLAAELASLSSGGIESQQNDNVSKTPSVIGVQNKDESSPTNNPKGLGVSCTEFVTPNWDPLCFKESLYPELNKKLEFSVKSRSIKDKRPKRTKEKLKQPSFMKKEMKQVHIPKQSSSQESLNSPKCYSPMDFSPYMETTTSDQPSPSASHSSVTNDVKDENFATAENNDVDIANQNCRESNKESPWKGFVFGSDSSFKVEQLHRGSGAASAAEHADGLNTGSHESVLYCFASGVDDRKYFTFSASSSAEGGPTSRKCLLQKKSKKKVGKKSFVISPSPNVKDGSSSIEFSNHAGSSVFNTVSRHEENKYSSKSKVQSKFEAVEQVKKGSDSTAAFQEACEMWRLRGNQSYKNGNLSKAEDFYTQGINSVSLSETAGCCIKPLVLCYSNRAATRISLRRMREALEDCMMAITVDPNFLKVYMRAANCHLVLGEVENAVQYYNKLLESGAVVCLDRQITIEAADGLQKAQKVAEWMNHSSILLEQKTSEATSNALEIIAEALSISSCSEKLLELKAEALYMLRKYEEAIQHCEQTLSIAEKNFASVVTDNCSVNVNASGSVNYSLARLWRWHLISKSYFCVGKLEMALDLLQKLEQVGSIRDKRGSDILESSIALAATIRELLRCKNAGNEAVRSGRYSEAVEHYTVALSSNVESRPFVAICFCNRAAAFQALGQIADAIADCSLAMALNGNYTKAVSRRAALHEMIRDYTQAASDLQRLVSILENQSAVKAKQSGSPGRSTGSKDIRQVRRRKSLMEEAAKNGSPLDFYLILGVKASDTAADIKKAYRKAALKHHPDKAGQFLARTESGDEGRLWKDIAHEVHKDADRLFKMIGEAYAILSDTTKRSEYDLEEELRKAPKESHQSSHYRRSSDAYNYSSQRSGNRQNWQDNWKTYGNSYSRW